MTELTLDRAEARNQWAQELLLFYHVRRVADREAIRFLDCADHTAATAADHLPVDRLVVLVHALVFAFYRSPARGELIAFGNANARHPLLGPWVVQRQDQTHGQLLERVAFNRFFGRNHEFYAGDRTGRLYTYEGGGYTGEDICITFV